MLKNYPFRERDWKVGERKMGFLIHLKTDLFVNKINEEEIRDI